MARTIYDSVNDAIEVARDNSDACADLARRGPSHVVVAEVIAVGTGYEIRAVTVESELDWNTTPNRYVVKRVDGRTCPLCGLIATDAGSWAVPGVAAGSFVGGLDPENCVACHDTFTTHGIAPRRHFPDGTSESILRPT